jgi:hypothetical protein
MVEDEALRAAGTVGTRWNSIVLSGARWEVGGEVLRDLVGYCVRVA